MIVIQTITPANHLINTIQISEINMAPKNALKLHKYKIRVLDCMVWYLIVSIPDLCTITYFHTGKY